MEREFAQKGLPPPCETMARQRRLGEGVETLDLETVKDFLRFYISTSRGRSNLFTRTYANFPDQGFCG
jgi:hypothetical protein